MLHVLTVARLSFEESIRARRSFAPTRSTASLSYASASATQNPSKTVCGSLSSLQPHLSTAVPLQTFFNKKSLSSQRRSSSQEGSLSCRDMNHLRHISEGGYEVMRIFMWCSTHMLSILRMYPVYSKKEIPIPWFFCFNLYNSYFWNINRTTCLLSHLKL